MTYRELLRRGETALSAAFIEEAEEKAMILLLYTKKWTKTDYLCKNGETADAETERLYEGFLRLAAQHVPVQHITHEAPFYGRSFYVDGHVLIPRFDTEVLVSEALKSIVKRAKEAENPGKEQGSPLRVLDLCTGSGCIAVTLFKELQRKEISCEVFASDLSPEALRIAEKNALSLQAEIEFREGNLFEAVTGEFPFDYIVSNPPYISPEVYETLSPEVRDHDPALALLGGEEGLRFYEKISEEAGKKLTPGGRIFLEIGEEQGEKVAALLKKNGFDEISVVKDLAGLDRVVKARFIGKEWHV